MSELKILDAATEAAWAVFENASDVDDMTEGLYECMEGAVEAAAPHIVAAELRRMAELADKECRKAQAELEGATADRGSRYLDLYSAAKSWALHRDECAAHAEELEESL